MASAFDRSPESDDGSPWQSIADTGAHSTEAGEAAGVPNAAPSSFLGRLGEDLGIGAGVLVTEGLSLFPSWNTPVTGADGAPATNVTGADRVGDHDILKRHEEDIGPKVSGYADTMGPGMLHDLVAGFGSGATQAPGDSYRLESGLSDWWHGE